MGRAELEVSQGLLLKDTYRLETLIGEGAMGVVYEASHTRLPRRFAIKFLTAKEAQDGKALERFQREAYVMGSLGHQNIAQVFDFDRTEGGTPYMVMELLQGMELTHYIKAGRLTLEQTASIVSQLANGLGAAHETGIVHRDLKPDNIFITNYDDELQVKILDFGISKIINVNTIATKDDSILGTPHYMAPEQVDGPKDEIDGRADVFALGAIAYECLSGKRAFSSPTLIGTLYQICQGAPVPLSNHVSDIPPRVENAIMRALSRDKHERTPSAVSFRDEFLAGCPADTTGFSRLPTNPHLLSEETSEKVIIYADLNCPFCYALGETLRRAGLIQQTEWRLIEHTPDASVPWSEAGPGLKRMLDSEVCAVRERVPTIVLETPTGQPNTRLGNLMVVAAMKKDPEKGLALKAALQRALFADNKDISDRELIRAECERLEIHVEPDAEVEAEVGDWQLEWEDSDPRMIPTMFAPNGSSRYGLGSPETAIQFVKEAIAQRRDADNDNN
jgi:serine/threonine protein kinase